jgi:hypothetical protein
MTKEMYLIIAIAIIATLLVVSIGGYLLFRRMKAPEGCEELRPDMSKCGPCGEKGCPLYARYHKEGEEQ